MLFSGFPASVDRTLAGQGWSVRFGRVALTLKRQRGNALTAYASIPAPWQLSDQPLGFLYQSFLVPQNTLLGRRKKLAPVPDDDKI